MDQTTKIDALLTIAKQNPDGFTVSVIDLKHVKSGWVVARKETQNSFGLEGLTLALAFAEKNTGMIGGWKEGKKFYFDAVEVFQTEERATLAGKANGQIAIYNIETLTLKFLE